MTKRISLEVAPGVTVNETDLALLRLLYEGRKRSVAVSVSVLAKQVGRSELTARVRLGSLAEKGLVTIRARYAENGGQLENAYGLTPLARAYLKKAEVQRVDVGQ